MKLKRVQALLLGIVGSMTFLSTGLVNHKTVMAAQISSPTVIESTEQEQADGKESELVAGFVATMYNGLRTEQSLVEETFDKEMKLVKAEGAESKEPDAEQSEAESAEKAAEELVISVAEPYVHIRSEASTESEILGKMYRHAVGTIIDDTTDGWYYIQSGTVSGYVKAEYVLRGNEGEQLADEVGQHFAKVTTMTLRVRETPSTEAKILGLLPEEEILSVSEKLDGWVKISFEEGEGYVSTDYTELYTEYKAAESIEEEQARLAYEEEQRLAAEQERARQIAKERSLAESRQKENAKQQENNPSAPAQTSKSSSAGTSQSTAAHSSASNSAGISQSASAGSSASTESAAASNNSAEQSTSTSGTGSTSQSAVSSAGSQTSSKALGEQIATYALQFVGNPYVYGGTSLTKGADCSGFVQSVYRNFGITLPRTSGAQGSSGTSIASLDQAQPGDLLWYSGHIAIYIGNGKIVHASNPSSGIKVSNASYRTILSIRRIV